MGKDCNELLTQTKVVQVVLFQSLANKNKRQSKLTVGCQGLCFTLAVILNFYNFMYRRECGRSSLSLQVGMESSRNSLVLGNL